METHEHPTLPGWSQRVRQARGAESREKFAARVGVSPQSIYRWENGLHRPGYEQARLLANATGKSALSFLGDDDPEEGEDALIRIDDLIRVLEMARQQSRERETADA